LKPLIFDHEAAPDFFELMSKQLDGETGEFISHIFPDGESYVRVLSECAQRDAVVITNLHQPNSKILPLIFLCETLKGLGISSIKLVCPYLPYMRQDIQLHTGEGITSRFFSKLISQYFDSLVTIDPHLHRYKSLDEIYTLETCVLNANPEVASWVKANIKNPIVIGPDSESEQWAASAASIIKCPYIILKKVRKGDKDVLISPPNAKQYNHLTPVLIDDIISTGRTMIKTAEALKVEGFQAAVCIGVHAVFSDGAYAEMKKSHISKIITCNTIPHETNLIDLSSIMSAKIKSQ
jgi:ribose-phosphate pyrophosphokinase